MQTAFMSISRGETIIPVGEIFTSTTFEFGRLYKISQALLTSIIDAGGYREDRVIFTPSKDILSFKEIIWFGSISDDRSITPIVDYTVAVAPKTVVYTLWPDKIIQGTKMENINLL